MSTSNPPSTTTINQILIKSTSTSTQTNELKPIHSKSSINEHEIETYNLTHQLLPHSNIYKLMKQSLPTEIKITNSSKTLIQSCVSEFLIFILSHSNSLLFNPNSINQRKTINGLDLLNSFKQLGFFGYFNVLKIYLIKYRSIDIHKKSLKSQSLSSNQLKIQSELTNANTNTNTTDPNESESRPTKRIKLSNHPNLTEE